MATIGTAYVQILPSTEGITNNLTEALTGASQTAGVKSGSKFSAGLAKSIGAGAIAIGTAAAAAVGAVVKSGIEASKAGDLIDKASQKMGVSASEYQTLAFAAEHCGFEVSTFQTAARNLANTDFEGNLPDAITAIQGIADPAERAAYAEELLGARAAQQMAALINGEESLEDYKTSLEELGGMMSDEMVKDSAAFQDAMTDMNKAVAGLKNGALANILPTMTNVVNGFAQLASGNEEGISMIVDGISGFLDSLVAMLPQMVSTGANLIVGLLSGLIENLPQFMEAGVQVITALCDALSGNLPTLIPIAMQAIITLVTGLLTNLPQLISAGLQLINGLVQGLMNAIPVIVSNIPALISAMYDAFIEGIATIVDVGTQIVHGIWSGISAGFGWIKARITEWCSDVIAWFKSVLKIGSPSRVFASEVGKWMAQGIGMGFEDEMVNVNRMIADDVQTSFSMNADINKGTGRNIVNITFNAKELSRADIDTVISKANRALAGGYA